MNQFQKTVTFVLLAFSPGFCFLLALMPVACNEVFYEEAQVPMAEMRNDFGQYFMRN